MKTYKVWLRSEGPPGITDPPSPTMHGTRPTVLEMHCAFPEKMTYFTKVLVLAFSGNRFLRI